MKAFLLLLAAVSLFSSEINLHKFFNKSTCDQVLKNDGYFTTCYSYGNKGALYSAYTIDGDTVNLKNIKKRPRFYEDKNIPKRYRSTYSDYTRNPYKNDRGHLAPDAAFDYSQRSLNAVYVMSNIIPQASTINRGEKAWMGLERYGRSLAYKLGKVNVLNGVIYGNAPKRIGHNQIAVPKAFWKMYYKGDFQRCFYFENKHVTDKRKKISDYEVDCKPLLIVR